ncbi:thiamine biosynthesis protein ThiI [Aerococcus suis]|uniref:Probable tRNA sulfurtransferase n=2 Tax=Aerococcus suis TaxID=371602 RepID=A0A1W1YLI5_9LACT|nr:thiamine biosynthesis protein ThiI [Aerococcus suis]
MDKKILIRYGELSTKGKNKKDFTKSLQKNIKMHLSDFPEITIHREHDFMFINLNGADVDLVEQRLQRVFGIQSYSVAYEIPRDFDVLIEQVNQLVAEELEARPDIQSFKIAASRSDNQYERDTMAINRDLGAAVSEAFPHLAVKMKKPDLTVRVKVRFDEFIVSFDWHKGSGGLPVGTSQHALLMLSGGIDSPVAGYLAMKRGIRLTAIHFASPPYTSPQALQKAKDLTHKLTHYSGWLDFVEIPFTETQEAIKENVPDRYLMTITRRMMMRIADALRDQFGALAIVNGESIGQVASQTLESMYAINDVTSTPIIRPVVTMDKLEIIELSQKIDTFDLSVQPFEDCCTVFAPASPKTKPRLDEIAYFEERLDIEGLVNRAVQGIKTERLRLHDNAKQEASSFDHLL